MEEAVEVIWRVRVYYLGRSDLILIYLRLVLGKVGLALGCFIVIWIAVGGEFECVLGSWVWEGGFLKRFCRFSYEIVIIFGLCFIR